MGLNKSTYNNKTQRKDNFGSNSTVRNKKKTDFKSNRNNNNSFQKNNKFGNKFSNNNNKFNDKKGNFKSKGKNDFKPKKQNTNLTITADNDNKITESNNINEKKDNTDVIKKKRVGKSWEAKNLFSPFYVKGEIDYLNEDCILSYYENKLYQINFNSSEISDSTKENEDKIEEEEINKNINVKTNLKLKELFYELNNEEVICFKFIQTKNLLIVCTNNFIMRIIDLNSEKKRIIQTINLNKVYAKKITTNFNFKNANKKNNEEFFAFSTSGNTLIVYDLKTMSNIGNFNNDNIIINDICFNKNKPVVYTANENHRIKVWDVLLGK